MAIDDGKMADAAAGTRGLGVAATGLGSTGGMQARFEQHFLPPHLSGDDLARLAELATPRRYHAGDAIFLAGDAGGTLMAVVSGQVRISAYSADGREALLNVIGPGDVLGEIDVIDGGDRSHDATAMVPTELLVLQRRDFVAFLKRNPELSLRFMEVMCRRLRSLQRADRGPEPARPAGAACQAAAASRR